MLDILNNLISLLMILLGFGLDRLILFSIAPLGFFVLGLFLIFCEYLIVKSIMKDPSRINLKMVRGYIKNYEIKNVFLVYIRNSAPNLGKHQKPFLL